MADDPLALIDALLRLTLRLARSASSGRVALAQLAGNIEPEWLLRPGSASLLGELEAARAAACDPLPIARVRRILQDAWGGKPDGELDRLEDEPVLVTPTAQVHRATLEGRSVGIKVQRPGLAAAVRQDLALLEGLAVPVRAAFPGLEVGGLLAEVRERVLDELDLETEGAAMRRFHRALRDHPLFVVPAPVTRLTHETVLVSEWLDGVPLKQAPDPDGAAARLVLFSVGALRWGTAHADLQLQEVLSLPDGRIAIVDLASTRSVDPARLELTVQALEAFVQEDGSALASAVQQLGWLPAELVPAAAQLARQVLGGLSDAAPVRLDSETVIGVRDRLLERPGPALRLLTRAGLAPEDLWPARSLMQLFAVIARVGATGPWRELVRAGLRDGWDAQLPTQR